MPSRALSVLMQDAAALVGEMLQADFSAWPSSSGEKMFLSVSPRRRAVPAALSTGDQRVRHGCHRVDGRLCTQ